MFCDVFTFPPGVYVGVLNLNASYPDPSVLYRHTDYKCTPEKGTRPYEPRHEKTGLRGFRPCLTQTEMYKHRSGLESCNFGFKKKRNCTIRVAKTKALISFAVTVTAKLICAFFSPRQKSVFLMTRLICHIATFNTLVKM